MRKRLAGVLLALLTTLGVFVAAAAPAGAAPKPKPATVGQSAPIKFTGTDSQGNPIWGQFRPQRAEATGQDENGPTGVALVGDMMVKPAKGGMKHLGEVRWPVALPTPAPEARALAAPGDVSAQAVCQVLNLVLGPLHLNLLGLNIDLNQVVLDLTADPNGGLLGSLLCSLAGGPAPGAIGGLIQQVIDILNQILGGLGGL